MCACSVASDESDTLCPYGPKPARLLCPWDSPGKNMWVGGFHALCLTDPAHSASCLTVHTVR